VSVRRFSVQSYWTKDAFLEDFILSGGVTDSLIWRSCSEKVPSFRRVLLSEGLSA